MGTTDVQFVLSADVARVVGPMIQAAQQMEKLGGIGEMAGRRSKKGSEDAKDGLDKQAAAARKAGEELDKAGRSGERAGRLVGKGVGDGAQSWKMLRGDVSGVAGELTSIIGGFVSLQTGIRVAGEIIAEEMKKIADNAERTGGIIKGALELGRGRVVDGKLLGSEFKDQLSYDKLNAPMLTRTRRNELAANILDVAPDLDPDTVAKMVGQAGELEGSGIDTNKFARSMASVKELFPEFNASDVADMALQAFQDGLKDIGPFEEQINRVKGNLSPQSRADLLEFISAASKEDQGSELIGSLLKYMEPGSKPTLAGVGPGGRMTYKETGAELAILQEQDMNKRFAMIMANTQNLDLKPGIKAGFAAVNNQMGQQNWYQNTVGGSPMGALAATLQFNTDVQRNRTALEAAVNQERSQEKNALGDSAETDFQNLMLSETSGWFDKWRMKRRFEGSLMGGAAPWEAAAEANPQAFLSDDEELGGMKDFGPGQVKLAKENARRMAVKKGYVGALTSESADADVAEMKETWKRMGLSLEEIAALLRGSSGAPPIRPRNVE